MNRILKYYINGFIKSINYRVFTRNKLNIGLKVNYPSLTEGACLVRNSARVDWGALKVWRKI